MKASIIKIGNSRGVRIPAKVIESVGFEQEVLIEIIDDNKILLTAVPVEDNPREGWFEAFNKIHDLGEDELLIDDDVDLDLLSDFGDEYDK
jgi:antitoxin MazE